MFSALSSLPSFKRNRDTLSSPCQSQSGLDDDDDDDGQQTSERPPQLTIAPSRHDSLMMTTTTTTTSPPPLPAAAGVSSALLQGDATSLPSSSMSLTAVPPLPLPEEPLFNQDEEATEEEEEEVPRLMAGRRKVVHGSSEEVEEVVSPGEEIVETVVEKRRKKKKRKRSDSLTREATTAREEVVVAEEMMEEEERRGGEEVEMATKVEKGKRKATMSGGEAATEPTKRKKRSSDDEMDKSDSPTDAQIEVEEEVDDDEPAPPSESETAATSVVPPVASTSSAPASGRCYRVERRAGTKVDPHLLTITESDGNKDLWPSTDGPITSNGAHRAFKDTDKPMQHWREKLGMQMSAALGLRTAGDESRWWMPSFPDQYKLFNKYTQQGKRADYYLIGSPKRAFRSPPECLQHFLWLANNRTGFCACKYCGDIKLQREVNQTLNIEGLETKATRPNGPTYVKTEKKSRIRSLKIEMGRSPGSSRASTPTTAKPRSATKKRSSPSSPAQKVTGPFIHPDRNRELDGKDGAWVRQHELCWARIDPIIEAGEPNLPEIVYWPVIVGERSFKSKPDLTAPKVEGQLPRMLHWIEYRCRFLGTNDEALRLVDDLLPWLAYPPPPPMFTIPLDTPEGIATVYADDEKQTLRRISIAALREAGLKRAITAFALSLQIAAHIISFWSQTDRYRTRRISNAPPKLEDDVTTSDWHYQGMFWGAERIWVGDVVRLLTTVEDLPEHDPLPSPPGEGRRHLLLRVDGIYKDATNEHAMVSGALYEMYRGNEGPTSIEVGSRTYEAPPGYRFHLKSKERTEHHLDVEHIAGRLYRSSDLQVQPLSLMDVIEYDEEDSEDVKDLPDEIGRLRALAGVIPASHLYMKVQHWSANRADTVCKSEQAGEREMRDFIIGKPDRERAAAQEAAADDIEEEEEADQVMSEEEA